MAPDTTLQQRSRPLLFRLAAIVIGLVVAGVFGEIASRATEAFRSDDRSQRESLDLLETNHHRTGSYRLKPNLDLVVNVGPYTVPIQTNAHGMRWREVTPQKQDRRRRIAFVGDSFTFGCWADSIESSLVGVFEKSVSPERWQVLNFGVGGYGYGDVELLLKEQALDFDLDFVILASFNGNDFRDTFLGVDKDVIKDGSAVLNEDIIARRVPAAYRQQDRTTSQPAIESSVLLRNLRRSALFRLVAPLFGWEHLKIDLHVNQRFIAYSFWSQVPYPAIATKAKDESLETLGRIRDLLAAKGVSLAVVALPTREQVYSREPYGPGFDIGLPQAHLQIYARDNDLPYLDLLPVFREHVARTNENIFLSGDTHYNNAGHELAGWHISEWFRCCVKTKPSPAGELAAHASTPAF